MRLLLAVTIALLLGAGGAYAGPYEDGVAAYKRGDDAAALSIFRSLAAQGHRRARFSLGVMYEKGLGVSQDQDESRKWYRLAAAQGDVDAQFSLGVSYYNGLGVARDFAEALKWFRLAVAQGHVGAQFGLGTMYALGLGVARDHAEALKLFRLAAEQGFSAGQFSLGTMYADGDGVAVDRVRAYMWMDLSTASGDAETVKGRDSLAKDMTPLQIAQARKLARECKQREFKGCD